MTRLAIRCTPGRGARRGARRSAGASSSRSSASHRDEEWDAHDEAGAETLHFVAWRRRPRARLRAAARRRAAPTKIERVAVLRRGARARPRSRADGGGRDGGLAARRTRGSLIHAQPQVIPFYERIGWRARRAGVRRGGDRRIARWRRRTRRRRPARAGAGCARTSCARSWTSWPTLPGVEAVVLGGSHARGRARTRARTSTSACSIATRARSTSRAVRALAARWNDTADPVVTAPLRVGPVGERRRVAHAARPPRGPALPEPRPRRARRSARRARAVTRSTSRSSRPSASGAGRCSARARARCRSTIPAGHAERLRRLVAAYPEALRAAVLRDMQQGASFGLAAFAPKFAARGDAWGTAACLARCVWQLGLALFALQPLLPRERQDAARRDRRLRARTARLSRARRGRALGAGAHAGRARRGGRSDRLVEPGDMGGVRACMNSADALLSSLRNSQLLRLVVVAFLALLLQIPIGMIERPASQERQLRRDEAVDGITSKWGNAQAITGPALVVPYTHRWIETDRPRGSRRAHESSRHAVFLPDRLARARRRRLARLRQRGIFAVPVYRREARPWPASSASRLRRARRRSRARWTGSTRSSRSASPTCARSRRERRSSGAGASVDLLPGRRPASPRWTAASTRSSTPAPARDRSRSRSRSRSNGSLGLYFTPVRPRPPRCRSRRTPRARASRATGSPRSATVAERRLLGRVVDPVPRPRLPAGLDLDHAPGRKPSTARASASSCAMPVDHYRMAERSVKYAGLFILLDVRGGLAGRDAGGRARAPDPVPAARQRRCACSTCSSCRSPEHLGFGRSRTRSRASSVIGDGRALLRGDPAHGVARGDRRRRRRRCSTATCYVLLMNEDYALLAGSIGAVRRSLAAIMFVTRQVDWYGLAAPLSSPPASSRR